jgi:hypothetical protein
MTKLTKKYKDRLKQAVIKQALKELDKEAKEIGLIK